jgi:hypothetical protein
MSLLMSTTIATYRYLSTVTTKRPPTGETRGMRTVGFLHTSPVHVPVFEQHVTDLTTGGDPVTTVSAVAEELLELSRRVGEHHPDVVAGIAREVGLLGERGAGRIVCTCSTIGGVAEVVGRGLGVDVVRVDRAMAERAVAVGGSIVVLAALESTLGPTRALIESVAGDSALDVGVRLVPGAWDRFEAGDLAGYHRLIAAAIVVAADDADVVVLAQASMEGASALVEVDAEVLTSPRLAVMALLG